MANNLFGNGAFNNSNMFPMNNTNNYKFPQMPMQPSGIQVISASNKEFAENYPLAPGNTIMFINYTGRRIYIKTQHQNGLSYDMEEMIFFTEQELQTYNQQLLSNATQKEVTPDEKYVPFEKYNALVDTVVKLQEKVNSFEEYLK